MERVRMAQFGTKHGHAAGKLLAMLGNPEVEVAGVWEPDEERREQVAGEGGPFGGVHWYASAGEVLSDESIAAVASEGSNRESLAHTERIVDAGKAVWYDKPAGDDWAHWLRVEELSRERKAYIQMGYMFRYHAGFRLVGDLARSGALGEVFGMRAHMSTSLTHEQRLAISVHQGGILYDLAGHMLDQIVWVLGRPHTVTSFLRNDATPAIPAFQDNTMAVLEYDGAMATVDIAAMETRPMARRYEVYGTQGSAIITEPFEPAWQVRIVLEEAAGPYAAGEHYVSVPLQSRQELYSLELAAFIATLRGWQRPDRTLEHETLVQETLLRAAGLVE